MMTKGKDGDSVAIWITSINELEAFQNQMPREKRERDDEYEMRALRKESLSPCTLKKWKCRQGKIQIKKENRRETDIYFEKKKGHGTTDLSNAQTSAH